MQYLTRELILFMRIISSRNMWRKIPDPPSRTSLYPLQLEWPLLAHLSLLAGTDVTK